MSKKSKPITFFEKTKNFIRETKKKIDKLAFEETEEEEPNPNEDLEKWNIPFFEPRDYFGESELFGPQSTREYTCKVKKDCLLFRIDTKTFKSIMVEGSILWPFLFNLQ